MMMREIERRETARQLPYQLAKQIRQLLDHAKQEHGKEINEEWTDLEAEVSELVFEEE